MKNKGLSLIEALVAISLLMVMIFIYSTFINLIKLNSANEDTSSAIFLASQEVEIIKQLSFSELTNRENAAFIGDVDLNVLTNGQGKLTIQDFLGDSNIKKVDVVIEWQRMDATNNINVSTLISLYGLSQE
jgi:hypothetical protein